MLSYDSYDQFIINLSKIHEHKFRDTFSIIKTLHWIHGEIVLSKIYVSFYLQENLLYDNMKLQSITTVLCDINKHSHVNTLCYICEIQIYTTLTHTLWTSTFWLWIRLWVSLLSTFEFKWLGKGIWLLITNQISFWLTTCALTAAEGSLS